MPSSTLVVSYGGMQANLVLNQSTCKMTRPPETVGYNERPRGRASTFYPSSRPKIVDRRGKKRLQLQQKFLGQRNAPSQELLCLFSSFLGGRGRGTDALKSLSLLSLSLLLCILPQLGEPLDQPPEDPMGQPQQDFFRFNQSQLVPTCRWKTPGIYYSRIPSIKEMSPLLLQATKKLAAFFARQST